MTFHRIEVTRVGENRYLVMFRFSFWNPSSQRRCVQRVGFDYDRRFLFLGQWTEPQRHPKKGDRDTLLLADGKGNYLGESFRGELFESGLNIEPHQAQNITIPLLLDVKTEEMTPLTADKSWHIGFSAYDPKKKEIAKCDTYLTLRELTNPDVLPILAS